MSETEPADVSLAPTSSTSTSLIRRVAGPMAVVLSIGLVVWALYASAHELHFADVARASNHVAKWKIGVSLLLASLGYLAMAGYDWVALRALGEALRLTRIVQASLVSQALANNVGAGPLTGAAMRHRFYAQWGLDAQAVAHTVSLSTLGFALGALGVAGPLFILVPPSGLTQWPLSATTTRGLGLAMVLGLAAVFALSARIGGLVHVRHWSFPLPRPKQLLAVLVVGITDWSLAVACCLVLLPRGVSWIHGATLFMVAQMAGFVSRVPGGLGVFEAVILGGLGAVPRAEIAASLILFRVVYYLIPLLSAGALLLSRSVWGARTTLKKLALTSRTILPPVIATWVFVSGLVLLISGATPASPGRFQLVERLLPTPLVAASHLIASVIGACLLVVARALHRRLDAARVVTVALCAAGALLSLAKGFDWEEAMVLTIVATAVWLARGVFDRPSRLLADRWSSSWFVSVGGVVVALLFVVPVAHGHSIDATDWWLLDAGIEGARSLRAGVFACTVVLIAGLASLVASPPRARLAAPSPGELDRAQALAAANEGTDGYLALVGDKYLLLADEGFAMFAVQHRSWVAMADPVGPPSCRRELMWRFLDAARLHNAWPVFYHLTDVSLPTALELGLSVIKMGEEARVDLRAFSLDGKGNKDLRGDYNRGKRCHLTLQILEGAEVAPLMAELRRVSDAWLAGHEGGERGFSMGFFEEAYVQRCPVAVVRHEGAVVAFANLWRGGQQDEVSIDLMRFTPGGPHNLMDFLFVELFLWARGAGYHWFNLGMAPLSGMETRPGAPWWNHVAKLVFDHGERFYGFAGLRRFKSKFHPAWRPRYLAFPSVLVLPVILADVAQLSAHGTALKRPPEQRAQFKRELARRAS